jgi:hypothetical protein
MSYVPHKVYIFHQKSMFIWRRTQGSQTGTRLTRIFSKLPREDNVRDMAVKKRQFYVSISISVMSILSP